METDTRINRAFDAVCAEEELKSSARAFVRQKREAGSRNRFIHRLRPAVLLACMMLVFVGGYGFGVYFKPVSVISIDINPSIELGVNSFDRVIRVEAFNEDGRQLIDDMQLLFLKYEEAVGRIIDSETVISLLAQDEELVIAVVGEDENRNEKLCNNLERYADPGTIGYCYSASPQAVEHAHSCGMSYGKYLAYQDALKQDETLTAEEIRDMTMHEIRDLIEETCHLETEPEETVAHHDQAGKKHRKGHH